MLEGLTSFLNSILNFIFYPLLQIDPGLAIIILAFLITLFITLIHKFTTDQKKMKSLKDDMKKHQDDMKKHKNDPKKMMEIQKLVMDKNVEFMKHSLKPMLFTIIPIFLVFGWFHANLAYYPISPGQEFEVTLTFDPSGIGKEVTLSSVISDNESKQLGILSDEIQKIEGIGIKKFLGQDWVGIANWKIKGTEGVYTLIFLYEGEEYEKNVIITNGRDYIEPKKDITNSALKKIEVSNDPVEIFGLGWFWIYFISAIISSLILRKILNVA